MILDAPDIALVAHGNIAVVAPQKYLGALGNNVAGAVDPGIDGGFGPAVADGLDLLDGVRHLHEPQGAGEQMGLEVRPQSEAHDGYIAVVHDLPKLVDLIHSKKLALIHNDHIAMALKIPAKPLVSIGLRGENIRPGREPDPAGKHMLPVPHIGAGL